MSLQPASPANSGSQEATPGVARSTLPLTILTGFLVSGKTTLLRHLLAHPATRDTAVLVNELVVYPSTSLAAWPFHPRASKVVVITRGLDRSMVDAIRGSLRALAKRAGSPRGLG